LNDIYTNVKLSITVKTDNVGVTFKLEDSSNGVQIIHMEMCYCFTHKFTKDGFGKSEFFFQSLTIAVTKRPLAGIFYQNHFKKLLVDLERKLLADSEIGNYK
jgi:hypothetical protein